MDKSLESERSIEALMTEAQAYYLSLDTGNDNVCRSNQRMAINCTGLCVLPQSFFNRSLQGREDYYLQYLCKGKMTVWLGGEQQVMRPGQAILYYPHTSYHYAMCGQEEVQYYWIHFTGYDAAQLVETCRIPNQTLLDVGSCPSLILDFEEIFRDYIVRDSCFEQSTAARLTSICIEISRRAEASGSGSSETDSRIYRVLSFIHKNYDRNLSIEQLALQEHLSPSRFRALFRECTGLSPMDYLTVLRINRARQLMGQTDLSVGEVASAVGYQDQLYFSRIFKRRTGMTPSAYRQNLRGGE